MRNVNPISENIMIMVCFVRGKGSIFLFSCLNFPKPVHNGLRRCLKMSDNKRTGHGMFGKGYYIALVLCAAAIGITGYLYNRNANEQTDTLAVQPTAATVPANLEKADDIPVIATQADGTAPTAPVTEATQEKKALKTAAPVSGKTVSGYSMEALSYNQTTRDWRVHNGIDIGAEEGTPVLAAADGQVASVYEDDTLGTTVVIRHIGGYTTQYSSLSENVSVAVGDTVTLGQTIGTVGSTALVETVMGPHVHFCVTYQDQPMDPAEFLKLGE